MAAPPPGDAWLLELEPALRRLDALLARAVDGRGEANPLAGLHIECDEAARLLTREPGAPLGAAGPVPPLRPGERLRRLERAFGLSPFDVDALLLAVAPELDLRYERLFAFLQDDVTRRRPTVDLALGLLCSSAHSRLLHRSRFAPSAPLLREGLVRLVADPHVADPPLLAQALRVDDQVVRYLLDDPALDERLARFARVADEPVRHDARSTEVAARTARCGAPVRAYFHGADRRGRHAACRGVAEALGAPALLADLARALEDDFEEAIAAVVREAKLRGAVLVLERAEALTDSAAARAVLTDRLADVEAAVVLSGDEPWPPGAPLATVRVAFPMPGFDGRRACWRDAFAAAGLAPGDDAVDALAERFLLAPHAIEAAVASVARDAAWAGIERPGTAALFEAARGQAGGRSSALTARVETGRGWADLVLPADRMAQLREICDRATFRHVVHDAWGFRSRLALGRGLAVLFSGVSGTGKTLAASVIAGELGLELLKVDLSQLVSKYIGETEKNLGQVFAQARASSAILFFDEADSLFATRSEVRDAHDRYANVETGYLLQKMDEYDGIVVLATNLRHNLDEAFLRRLHVVVDFPFPTEPDRRRIWEIALPDEAPLAADVDLVALARHEVAGGSIRNISVAAAFAAAARGGPIEQADLEAATRGELRKLGRTVPEPVWEAA